MSRFCIILPFLFCACFCFALSDTTYTMIAFSEKWDRVYDVYEKELLAGDSLPVWAYENVTMLTDSTFEKKCLEYIWDDNQWHLSRLDSSFAIHFSAVQSSEKKDDYFHCLVVWHMGKNNRVRMADVVKDEFKFLYECGELAVPWTFADSMIRHVVDDVMLQGDETADIRDFLLYNNECSDGEYTRVVEPGSDKTNKVFGYLNLSWVDGYEEARSLIGAATVSLPRTASAPMARFRKVPGGFEVLDKTLVGKSYSLFDLNGIQIRTGELPAVLKTPAVPTILRIKERIHYLR